MYQRAHPALPCSSLQSMGFGVSRTTNPGQQSFWITRLSGSTGPADTDKPGFQQFLSFFLGFSVSRFLVLALALALALGFQNNTHGWRIGWEYGGHEWPCIQSMVIVLFFAVDIVVVMVMVLVAYATGRPTAKTVKACDMQGKERNWFAWV
ncbi:hypothetical protein P171DRAFT_103224 [Karstenula rhodostoma CBS 690.94]|uniref:Uncharacterized protein n=1 Tax=Karstenula rhodostoma CBS 690.94 TaxID=1392251 RepID=A0A9P4PCI0_9PLEO|nr:hypothetical protein P171DRAFT_103224 [Karstenula rhodostoma CBS 690.94]